ncbi:glutathione transferase GstA [Pseudomonas cavernicola]|uniref:Glutathione transferase GstA n=1 Tax=Pseudomonas cavernicola TaxID=2320866 RepID=A0A418XIU5_9PSED|nr:glutathione transferase GstA [Pseudomonas cavernicola]RJG12380.1 glutathione transferase GstA [Pseudomonas cavernicola]
MKLYYSPGACSLAPHIVLHESGLPFSLERVDLETHKTETGADYYGINPKGYVPTLELDNGERLTEGPVITQYISDKAGNTELMPAAGSQARYRVMEWQCYLNSEVHQSFAPLFDPTFDAASKAIFISRLQKKFGWVSAQLRGKQYLTGNSFTAADAYLFVLSGWAPYLKFELPNTEELQGYLQRIAARPAVQKAMKTEGLHWLA